MQVNTHPHPTHRACTKSVVDNMNKFNFIRDGETKLPPGFRFQPTEEEIVFQYLARKIFSCPLPASVIPEIDASGFDLSKLLAGDSERERYVFANRELINIRNINKLRRGNDCVGFWKATSSDRPIVCSTRMPFVGIRRTLVFYKGKHPHAVRTDCFMHVYCLALSRNHHKRLSQGGLVQIGEWVLCRVFSKRRSTRSEVCKQQSYGYFVAEEMSDTDSCSSSSESDSSVVSEAFAATHDNSHNV